jgi:purine-nucleoside phosphorylase
MYTTIDIEAYKKHLGLPEDYSIDGLLCSGTWDLYADSRHIPYLKKAFEILNIEPELNRIEGEELGHAFEIKFNNKRYWFVPVMGTAVMSQYAHVASMLGSKKNILIGVVGGLKPGIKPADFIIPTASKGNENALMYQRSNLDLLFYPDKELTTRLKQRLGDTKVYEGTTNTCEVMFAETPEDIKEWSSQGYLGVEMEAAMMFALSNYFKIPSASILFVADNLIENITMIDSAHQDSKKQRLVAQHLKYSAALAELLDLEMKVVPTQSLRLNSLRPK